LPWQEGNLNAGNICCAVYRREVVVYIDIVEGDIPEILYENIIGDVCRILVYFGRLGQLVGDTHRRGNAGVIDRQLAILETLDRIKGGCGDVIIIVITGARKVRPGYFQFPV